ncbi:ABC transporter substrate-binding protein [Brevibacillus fluminis]|uniref:ABC transporter substrate-binding protein n=1 Tax=Brevibacillus fluminis TaxID=511487 RepID=UPI003F888D91
MMRRKPYVAAALMLMLSILLPACGGANPAAGTDVPAKQTAEKHEVTFRDFQTEKGVIKIPEKPQRIVTDYYGGDLLAVGGNVVGVEPTAFQNPFLRDLLKHTQNVGEPTNVEKVLTLAPDLIVVMKPENYEALSKIAPTLYIPYGTTTNIKETVKLFGDIVGEKEKADEFLKAYEKKAAEGREKLKGIVDPNATVGLYELTDKGEIWIFGDNAGRGGQAVYNALQLKMPDINNTKNQTLQLSMETLPQYAADYMFLTTYDPEKKGDQLKKLKESKVWQGLRAAKTNTIFYNDFDTFYRYDPIAITGQIDLIVDMLIKRAEENKKSSSTS